MAIDRREGQRRIVVLQSGYGALRSEASRSELHRRRISEYGRKPASSSDGVGFLHICPGLGRRYEAKGAKGEEDGQRNGRPVVIRVCAAARPVRVHGIVPSLPADEAFALSASALSGTENYSFDGDVTVVDPGGWVSDKAKFQGEVSSHGNLKLQWSKTRLGRPTWSLAA